MSNSQNNPPVEASVVEASPESGATSWIYAKPLEDIVTKGTALARISGKQVALFNTSEGIKACDNRCPHEGYPLTEGSLSGKCTLTCNWHNWKFDLDSGDNLYGGDQLRTYPVDIRIGETGQEVWIDVSDPPYAQQYEKIRNNLHGAFIDHSYDRIAREIARLEKIGADPLDAIRLSIMWSVDHLEFGWTHAYAAMADWLSVYLESEGDKELQLLSLVECVAHTSFDVLREDEYPFSPNTQPFNANGFVEAIESEDEPTATAMIRGGLAQGLQFEDFEYALTQAAFAHYNDFGHSLIYVTKAQELILMLGIEVAEPLLLSLVRNLIFATREDKIPEFRSYQSVLESWTSTHTETNRDLASPCSDHWFRKGIKPSLETTLSFKHLSADSILHSAFGYISKKYVEFRPIPAI